LNCSRTRSKPNERRDVKNIPMDNHAGSASATLKRSVPLQPFPAEPYQRLESEVNDPISVRAVLKTRQPKLNDEKLAAPNGQRPRMVRLVLGPQTHRREQKADAINKILKTATREVAQTSC
jgi:hypothetical protein